MKKSENKGLLLFDTYPVIILIEHDSVRSSSVGTLFYYTIPNGVLMQRCHNEMAGGQNAAVSFKLPNMPTIRI